MKNLKLHTCSGRRPDGTHVYSSSAQPLSSSDCDCLWMSMWCPIIDGWPTIRLCENCVWWWFGCCCGYIGKVFFVGKFCWSWLFTIAGCCCCWYPCVEFELYDDEDDDVGGGKPTLFCWLNGIGGLWFGFIFDCNVAGTDGDIFWDVVCWNDDIIGVKLFPLFETVELKKKRKKENFRVNSNFSNLYYIHRADSIACTYCCHNYYKEEQQQNCYYNKNWKLRRERINYLFPFLPLLISTSSFYHMTFILMCVYWAIICINMLEKHLEQSCSPSPS